MSPAPRRDRETLSRGRVLAAASELADAEGLGAVSMRRLGQELGVEAMSLYTHVSGKEDLLDGMAQAVVLEINDAVAGQGLPAGPEEWQAALRTRILTARQVLLRHPWAVAALQDRAALSQPVIAYHDGIVAIMLAGGFDHDLAHHSLHALGSRALGFAHELFSAGGDDVPSETELDQLAGIAPHLAAMLAEVAHTDGPDLTLGWCDDQSEFEFGLDVLLDGLERRRSAAIPGIPPLGS